jgi:5'-nucleotidase/UDP-sugar diphosphatase
MTSNLTGVRRAAALFAIVVLGGLVLSCEQNFSPNFALISVHAVKGRIFADVSDDGVRTGGFSLLSALAREAKGDPDPVIFIADNNSIHGTPAAYFSRGEHIIKLLNSVGCDLLIADSREFYYGTARLAELALLADFPIVSANIRNSSDGDIPGYLQPYYYDSRMNVLIIGLSSPSLISRNLPANVAGLRLISAGAAVRDALMKFQAEYGISVGDDLEASVERPFIIVNAVSHKLSVDEPHDILNELAAFPQIDLLVLGERDLPMDGMAPPKPSPRYTLARRGDYLPVWDDFRPWWGRLVLVDDRRSDNGALVDRIAIANSRPVSYVEHPLDSRLIEPDDGISELLFSIRRESESELSRPISATSGDIDHRFSGESPLANLVTDAIREYMDCDLFLINSGSIREGLEEGALTLFDAYRILPFESGLLTVEITGAQLIGILDRSAGNYQDSEGEKGFLQASGLEMTIVNREGRFAVDAATLLIDGQPLDPAGVYRLGLTTYLFQGGDGYDEFARLRVIREYPESLLTAFIGYLDDQENAFRDLEGRVRFRLD